MVDRLLIAGNWKMNLDKAGAIELTDALNKDQDTFKGVDVAVFPPSYVLLDAEAVAVNTFGTILPVALL